MLGELIERSGGTITSAKTAGSSAPKPRDRRSLAEMDTRGAVNQVALARLEDWVPALFPGGTWQTGGAYRIKSDLVGQPEFEEDLSFHPTEGIRDFGSERSFTPTGVIAHFCKRNDAGDNELAERDAEGNPVDAVSEEQALQWLVDRLCIDLEKLKAKQLAGDFDEPVPPEMLPAIDRAAPSGKICATPFAFPEPSAIEPRQWLYGAHYIRKFLSVTASAGGTGKSSLAVAEQCAMASGKNLLGERVADPLRVWNINGEDPYDESARRVVATCKRYGLSRADFGDRLFISSGRDADFVLARQARGELELSKQVIEALRQNIRERSIDVVIFDPFVSMHEVTEGDNGQMNVVCRQLAMLADETGCAIELVHHVRKGAAGQGDRGVDDARGAGAIVNAARSVRVLNRMSPDDAKKAGIDEARTIFRLDSGKANLAPPAAAKWYQILSVPLNNGRPGLAGDEVGVVTAWQWPDPFEEVTPEQIRAVQEAVAAGEWREHPKADAWVGRAIAPVMGLDADDPSGQYALRTLIRSWLEDGTLARATRKDARRKDRVFVETGKRSAE